MMDRALRRLHGLVLRLAFARRASILVGVVLAVPAGWLMLRDYAWESWATDGAALVLGATGVALLLGGLGGRRGDWVDPDQ